MVLLVGREASRMSVLRFAAIVLSTTLKTCKTIGCFLLLPDHWAAVFRIKSSQPFLAAT